MPYQMQNSTIESLIESLCEKGFEGMAQAMETLLNEVMKIERSHYIGAIPYERTSKRTDYANGFKPKTVKTRLGSLSLEVPQVRSSEFYPSALEKGIRSERALRLAVAEMYVQGVSTRKVAEIAKVLCGENISSSEVSRAAKLLDAGLQKWRERPLGLYKYLILDAIYEKTRMNGCVVDAAVLIAYGVNDQGMRECLGVSVSLSEQEVHWRAFLESLIARGLHGLEMITSDAHAGLKAAKRAVFPSVPWQRCQFHLQQNASAHVTRKSLKEEVASDIRSVFNAPNRQEADRLLDIVSKKYQASEPKLSAWMMENIPESLTVFQLPEGRRKRLRTSNMAERVNKEIRRRTKVVGIFPHEESCLRLVSSILVEINEGWINGDRYLNLEN